MVQVLPEPALEAMVDGQDIVCILALGGQRTTLFGGENHPTRRGGTKWAQKVGVRRKCNETLQPRGVRCTKFAYRRGPSWRHSAWLKKPRGA